MTTEAPFGSPSSRIGPRHDDSAANPRLVIARYIAEPPAAAPISSNRRRRLRGVLAASLKCLSNRRDLLTRVTAQPSSGARGEGRETYHAASGATNGLSCHATRKFRGTNLEALAFAAAQYYVVAVRQVCRICPPWAFPPQTRGAPPKRRAPFFFLSRPP